MLGTTINREGIREDIDNRDYTYSPDRPVPSFDARLGRQQPTYDRYASAEVVNQRPVARQDMYAPVQDPAREDLWNRLNTNNVSRGAVENRYSARPEVEVFEPMRPLCLVQEKTCPCGRVAPPINFMQKGRDLWRCRAHERQG